MKKKLFRKNQLIITALALMIAVAGYINYSDSKLKVQKKGSDREAVEEGAETTTDDITEDIESLDLDLADEEIDTSVGETTSADGEEKTADVAAETPGEAVLADASTYAAQARISREQVRSQNKETLLEIINNKDLTEEEKQEAVDSMVTMTDQIEKEAAAEALLEAKGFKDVVVSLNREGADVMVASSELDAPKLAQIEDVVKRKTGVDPANIVITPMDETDAK